MPIKKLDAETRAGVAARMSNIQQKEFDLSLLRNELAAFISRAAGVNLDRQDWTLDLEHGLLERTRRNGQ